MPLHPEPQREESRYADNGALFEEGRVYYVGATRAKKMLVTAGNSGVGVKYLDSGRIYRNCGEMRAQLELGRDGDVDKMAHLAWDNCLTIQRALAENVGRTVSVTVRAAAEDGYVRRIFLSQRDTDGITRVIELGQLSMPFQRDLEALWSNMDSERRLKPSENIHHLYMVSVATVGLSEQERNAVKPPFNRSGMGLAPVIKGFPMIQFLYRRRGRYSR
jgi:hypothetical protein